MLRALINKLSTRATRENKEFSKRILFRHKTFWEAPEAETVRNTVMHATDPIEKWQDVKHWQRKLSNKYNSREFAKKHGCRVAELYWKGRDIENIPFDTLPNHFVIRPTIGYSCGMVFLMSNGLNLMDKKTYTPEDLKAELKKGIDENPLVEFLIEEFVRTEAGEYEIPKDYKLYLFNGELATIQVINRTSAKSGSQSSFDENWNLLEKHTNVYAYGGYREPPACLQDIIEQGKRLSKAYGIFVRIDFYATDKGAVFGEFTPTPARGMGFTDYANKRYTAFWDKHCAGKI
ncbi:ATP-grasp fold amidoligase family protein [Pontibacter arcticus]|uniref:TupA-like ATPgrasp n=1 Tax=Pontibacter arcticus TaxID=2080288 RepID=A0A364RGH9_9BACT|nr:ATP-grasp fold amidoligase family protein [Pontibacter arcticus]RAU83365.1 hypothetical protein DP923_09180 [Pontibacter arcticus]